MMTTLPLSGLGLAAGGGPLGQDTEDVTDIVTTIYIGGRCRCRRQWQCITVAVYGVPSYDVCAHCGDWRTVLHTVRWSGTDQNTGKVRHSIRDQATLHHYYQVPDTIIQMTVDRVRRLPRQDYCHVVLVCNLLHIVKK